MSNHSNTYALNEANIKRFYDCMLSHGFEIMGRYTVPCFVALCYSSNNIRKTISESVENGTDEIAYEVGFVTTKHEALKNFRTKLPQFLKRIEKLSEWTKDTGIDKSDFLAMIKDLGEKWQKGVLESLDDKELLVCNYTDLMQMSSDLSELHDGSEEWIEAHQLMEDCIDRPENQWGGDFLGAVNQEEYPNVLAGYIEGNQPQLVELQDKLVEIFQTVIIPDQEMIKKRESQAQELVDFLESLQPPKFWSVKGIYRFLRDLWTKVVGLFVLVCLLLLFIGFVGHFYDNISDGKNFSDAFKAAHVDIKYGEQVIRGLLFAAK